MIKRLRIVNLFDRFNYDINLKNDVTILTGPNGYGKSTILKIIIAINKGNFKYFKKLNFKIIEFEFINDDRTIKIEKEIRNGDEIIKINGCKIRDYINFPENEKFYLEKLNAMHTLNNFINFIGKNYDGDDEDSIDNIIIKSRKGQEYIKKLKIAEDDDLFTDYMDLLSLRKKQLRNIKPKNNVKSKGKINIRETIDTLENNREDIYFIKEQRLYKKIDNEKVVEIIEDIPRKIKNIINDTSQKYSKKANIIDSTYPLRLLNTLNGITEEEYTNKLEKLREKFEKLNDYEISDTDIINNVRFKKEHSKALKVYFDDFDKKYKVYEDAINRFDSFKRIINNKLSFKNIKISKEDGLSVFNDNGKKIKLSMLSSGEKQQIVLYYNLIFELEDKTVLMIDEPEISLHIVWQQDFMNDLLEVIKDKNIKVIVATHSPQILSNHWDNQIDLGELYGE